MTLAVLPRFSRPATAAAAGTTSADRALARRVRQALLTSPELDASRLRVTVVGGDVWLRGTLRGSAARLAARNVATTIAGVHRVVDGIEVHRPRRGRDRDDADIQRDVDLLIAMWDPQRRTLRARVRQHVVEVIGVVPDADSRRRIRGALERIRGVHVVENRIRLEAEEVA